MDHTAGLRVFAQCTEQAVPSSQQYVYYPVVQVPRTLPQLEGTAQIAEAWSSFLSEIKSESRDHVLVSKGEQLLLWHVQT